MVNLREGICNFIYFFSQELKLYRFIGKIYTCNWMYFCNSLCKWYTKIVFLKHSFQMYLLYLNQIRHAYCTMCCQFSMSQCHQKFPNFRINVREMYIWKLYLEVTSVTVLFSILSWIRGWLLNRGKEATDNKID